MPVSVDHGLTAKDLRAIYTLEEPLGILRHKHRPVWMFKASRTRTAYHICNNWNSRWAGKIVGRISQGYLNTTICLPDGRKLIIQVHNIIECMRTGVWPTEIIDHKNRDKLDNRLGNHRLASVSQQNMNKPIQRNNTSGVTGVRWIDPRQKWEARIKPEGESTVILYYGDSFEDAVAARRAGELKYFGKYRRG